MALDMILELEGDDPDWVALSSAIEAVGVADFLMVPEKSFSGYFSNSGMPFWLCSWDAKGGPITAEGDHGCNFITRCSLCFRVINSRYDESVDDLREFLSLLSKLSPLQFVLSFQSEDIRARHCGGKFEFLWLTDNDAAFGK